MLLSVSCLHALVTFHLCDVFLDTHYVRSTQLSHLRDAFGIAFPRDRSNHRA